MRGVRCAEGNHTGELWQRARELADHGCTVTQGARILGIHHTTAIYIARRMGFEWANANKGRSAGKQETVGRVERMMRLAGR